MGILPDVESICRKKHIDVGLAATGAFAAAHCDEHTSVAAGAGDPFLDCLTPLFDANEWRPCILPSKRLSIARPVRCHGQINSQIGRAFVSIFGHYLLIERNTVS